MWDTFCTHFVYISCIHLVQFLYTKCIHNFCVGVFFNSSTRNINGTNKDLSLSLPQKQNVVQGTLHQQICME